MSAALRTATALALLLLAACGAREAVEETPRPAVVTRAEADGSRVEAFAGVVQARHESPLGFRIAGKLTERRVEVGDRVETGQVLATLDPEDLSLQVEARRSELVAARADLELARSERDRYRAMVERKLVSASLYEARENAFEAAAARVEGIEAALAVNRNQATYATLRADHAGVVTAISAEAGQVLAAGQPVLRLAREDELEVVIALPEQHRAAFSAGDDAAIELWAREGQRTPGRIREISPEADPMARTFAARIAFDAAAASAWLGQSARVYFLRQGGAALTVPLTALHADEGSPALWVVDPERATVSLRPVRIGPYSSERVPVIAGLEAGEWIVAAGVHLLREGQAIVPIDRDNRRLELLAATR